MAAFPVKVQYTHATRAMLIPPTPSSRPVGRSRSSSAPFASPRRRSRRTRTASTSPERTWTIETTPPSTIAPTPMKRTWDDQSSHAASRGLELARAVPASSSGSATIQESAPPRNTSSATLSRTMNPTATSSGEASAPR